MRKSAETIRATTGRPLPGFTMLELLVVLAIILFVCASVVGGYSNMQKAQRLNVSAERVVNSLHLARSLAISNNAVYHVHFVNYEAASTPDPYAEQAIAIQCYPNTTTALQVRTEPDPAGDNRWSQYKELKEHDGSPYIAGNAAAAHFNNYRVDYVRMEAQIWFGQELGATGGPTANTVLHFYPDGSASTTMTIFVTENREWRDGRAPVPLRVDGFNRGQANVRMVRVFQGGMIKQLNQRRGDKLNP